MAFRRLFLVLAFSSAGLCSASAADVSGTWKITGPITPVCTFAQTGNNLSGACRGPGAEGPLTGSIDGQTVKWVFTRKNMASGQTIAPVEFSGTLNGQTLSGTMTQNGGANPIAFTAQFQPGASPISLAGASAPQAPTAQASPSNPPAQPAAQSAVNTAPPKTVFDIDLDGSAIHRQSGLVCPVTVQGWARNSTILYDKPGFDVSCGYRNAAGSAITIYFTRRPASALSQVLDQTKQGIIKATPGTSPRDGTATAPRGFDWLKAGFERQEGEIWSDFFITQLHDWEYQVRITYKPADLDAVNAALAALSDNVARTAGKKLAACEGSAAPQRNGKRITDANEIRAYSVGAASQARAVIAASRGGGNWCAEGATSGSVTLDYWRNAAVDAKAPALDRLMGIDDDTHWVVASDAAATAAAAKSGTPHQVYDVLVERKDDIILVGVFDGRPSPNDLAQMLSASRPIYASVNKATSNISFFNPP